MTNLPLDQWVNGKANLPQRFIDPKYSDCPSHDWIAWVSIEEYDHLYKANQLNWLSLNDSIKKTERYIAMAEDLLYDGLYEGSLDNEDALELRETLGSPPIQCSPIYFVSVGNGENERVVYIGKTKNSNRFSGGHAVALKLHDPCYCSLEKKIYRASIWFYFNDDYMALDWIKPTSLSEELFDSIESQLIYDFQPELNTDKKTNNLAKWKFDLEISNHLQNQYLHNRRIYR